MLRGRVWPELCPFCLGLLGCWVAHGHGCCLPESQACCLTATSAWRPYWALAGGQPALVLACFRVTLTSRAPDLGGSCEDSLPYLVSARDEAAQVSSQPWMGLGGWGLRAGSPPETQVHRGGNRPGLRPGGPWLSSPASWTGRWWHPSDGGGGPGSTVLSSWEPLVGTACLPAPGAPPCVGCVQRSPQSLGT